MRQNINAHKTQRNNYSLCTRSQHIQQAHEQLAYVVEPLLAETQHVLLKFNDSHFSEERALYNEIFEEFSTMTCEYYLYTAMQSVHAPDFSLTDDTCCIASSLSHYRSDDSQYFMRMIHTLHTLFNTTRRNCVCDKKQKASVVIALRNYIQKQFTLFKKMRNFNLFQYTHLYDGVHMARTPVDVNGIHIILARSQLRDMECTYINLLHIDSDKINDFNMNPFPSNIVPLQHAACQTFSRRSQLYTGLQPHTQIIENDNDERYARYTYIPVSLEFDHNVPVSVNAIRLRVQIAANTETYLRSDMVEIFYTGTMTMVAIFVLNMLLRANFVRNITQRASQMIKSIRQLFTMHR